ncbi:CbiX/SirB N-terminal domain-containing protein [Kribbella albertanoniae]|uniref:Sirohydrochlorin chelatase n=1 Tax=Kribbella albertanoniae TaxID=1266829 RepID=A0A4R4Q1U0_9ACTN|nr:CbiX/SirB N-terminal domain-containing protein [Kribbella albertanoniae]TDC28723.1 sirohydrochlorin chelatase [Kribbella albertanoniae]
MRPDLIAVAHGTADPRGIRVVHDIVRQMAQLRPELSMSLGFVDVDVPAMPGLVDRVMTDAPEAVIVPLLLSSGYHVHVDIADQVARHPGLTAAPALGPHALIADILVDRLGDLSRTDHVVLAAAGSTDPRAQADCERTAALLHARIHRPVTIGYLAGRGRRLPAVLATTPGRLAVANYLLAPGHFSDRLHQQAGPHRVTPPLGADLRLARLALARYDAARQPARVAV